MKKARLKWFLKDLITFVLLFLGIYGTIVILNMDFEISNLFIIPIPSIFAYISINVTRHLMDIRDEQGNKVTSTKATSPMVPDDGILTVVPQGIYVTILEDYGAGHSRVRTEGGKIGVMRNNDLRSCGLS